MSSWSCWCSLSIKCLLRATKRVSARRKHRHVNLNKTRIQNMQAQSERHTTNIARECVNVCDQGTRKNSQIYTPARGTSISFGSKEKLAARRRAGGVGLCGIGVRALQGTQLSRKSIFNHSILRSNHSPIVSNQSPHTKSPSNGVGCRSWREARNARQGCRCR